MIAALFVAARGCYFGLPGVDPWDEARDARRYAGPHRVVAHPPCERWGNFSTGSPINIAAGRREVTGADDRCFAAALAALHRFGGVLEHPAGSRAWAHFGLIAPSRRGGWSAADGTGLLWTAHVEQGFYGHRAPKPSWLLVTGPTIGGLPPPPDLRWGKSNPAPMPRPRGGTRGSACEIMGKQERLRTPWEFRDLLLTLAAGAR